MNCVACGERHFKLGEIWSSGQMVTLLDLFVESLCPRHIHELTVYMHTIPERAKWRLLDLQLKLEAQAGKVPLVTDLDQCVKLHDTLAEAVLAKISEWAAQSAVEIAKAEEEKEQNSEGRRQ